MIFVYFFFSISFNTDLIQAQIRSEMMWLMWLFFLLNIRSPQNVCLFKWLLLFTFRNLWWIKLIWVDDSTVAYASIRFLSSMRQRQRWCVSIYYYFIYQTGFDAQQWRVFQYLVENNSTLFTSDRVDNWLRMHVNVVKCM